MATRSTFDGQLESFAGRRLSTTIPDAWASLAEVEQEIGLTRSLAMQLMIAGVARRYAAHEPRPHLNSPYVIRSGSRLFIPRSDLDALRNVPFAQASEVAYINVRLGPGTINDRPGPRKYLGYSIEFTATEAYEAATHWWYFRDIDNWCGRYFVASVAGFVTLTGRIEHVIHHPTRDRVKFDVDITDDQARETFENQRIPVHRGGPALKISAAASG
jgi:hypothetical protein